MVDFFSIKMSMADENDSLLNLDDELDDGSNGLFGKILGKQHPFGGNLTGLVILCIVLTIIAVVFFGCYLLMRFMHRALSGDGGKETLSSPYSNVVIHSKRVYEIQAEEGCFNGAPDPMELAEEGKSNTPTDDSVSLEVVNETSSARSSFKKPETGDFKVKKADYDDPRQMVRKKERKIHKDSVCAVLFRPQPEPRMV